MLWASWEEIRDNLEDEIAKLDIYDKDDQCFWFDFKSEFTVKIHTALTRSLKKSHIEKLDD